MARPKSKYYDLMFKDGRATREYSSWWSMQNRRGQSYENVKVDEIFKNKTEGFKAFLDEVGLCPNPLYDLDRIDNSKGYEPGNLQWVSRSENLRNRSVTLRVIQNDGVELSLQEFCEKKTHQNPARLRQRYRHRKTKILHASELT